MFDRNASLPTAANKGSPISQALSLLGTAGGIAASILLTPLLFSFTEGVLHSYLANQWGADLAALLTGVMGVIECIVIYVFTKLIISIAATATIVALAVRRVPLA